MAQESMIQVLVVDDSEPIRHSLRQLFSTAGDINWVGESSDGRDTIEQCEQLQPDVVLIDVVLPHVDVAHITQTIRERFPAIQVIGIFGFEERALVDHILQSGAVMCLPKSTDVVLMSDAVRQVTQTADHTHVANTPGRYPPA